MNKNKEIIEAFIAAWSTLDVDLLVSFFAEDGVYYNMPTQPVQGHQHLHGFITAFLGDWTRTTWDIKTLMAEGDVVMVERLDRTEIGAVKVDLPCCGVFEMEDGKIKQWRDYFDLATYTQALAPPQK
jgi:limonene-1,2-epoxide hydrolase